MEATYIAVKATKGLQKITLETFPLFREVIDEVTFIAVPLVVKKRHRESNYDSSPRTQKLLKRPKRRTTRVGSGR